MITVAELIAELQKYDPGLIVSVSGYEEGVTDTFFVSHSKVVLNKNADSHVYGEHEPVSANDKPQEETAYRILIERKTQKHWDAELDEIFR